MSIFRLFDSSGSAISNEPKNQGIPEVITNQLAISGEIGMWCDVYHFTPTKGQQITLQAIIEERERGYMYQD